LVVREEEEEEEIEADKSIEADMLLLPISIPTTCCDCDCASGPSDEAIIEPGAEAEDAAKGEAASSPPKDKA